MSEVKRWEFVGGDGPGAYPQEEPDWRMVSYTDHVAAMEDAAKLDDGLVVLRKEIFDALVEQAIDEGNMVLASMAKISAANPSWTVCDSGVGCCSDYCECNGTGFLGRQSEEMRDE